jgi:hypothetical protein
VAEAQTSSKTDLTRGKAILIGVLAVALIGVLYIQFGRGGAKPAGEPAGYRPPRPAVAVQPVNAAAKAVTLASAKTPSNPEPSKDKNAATVLVIDGTRWKSPKLETIVAYDPFALPPSFPQPPKATAGGKANGADGLIAAAAADDAKRIVEAAEQLHMHMEELKQQGVHVIVRKGDQYVAVIGDRMLHVGDKIDEFTVTAIDPDDGVHIERKESP